MKKTLLLIVMLSVVEASAQKHGKERIDSLYTVLKTAKADSARVNTMNDLASEYINTNPDSAVSFSKKAQALAIKLNYRMGIANACLIHGKAMTNLGNFEKAMKSINDALIIYDEILKVPSGTDKKPSKVKILKQKSRAYFSIGIIFSIQGNYPEALKNYITSLKIKEEIGDKKGIVATYGNIGLIYSYQSNYPEALKSFFTSLKISEEIGDKQGVAYSYNNLGIIYKNQGNFNEALKNFFSTLKISEEIGDKQGIYNSHINIGNIYSDQGNFPEALKNYFASLKITEETGDKNGIALSYNNIGTIYANQSNYPEALKNYFASLKIKEEVGDKKGIAGSYNLIGLIYSDQGNYPEALKNFFSSLKIFEEIGDKEGIAYSHTYIGKIYTKQKKNNAAIQYLNKGLSLAKEIGNLDIIKESYDGMAALDSAQGNFKQSLEHYKMYITMRDSTYNKENTKKLLQSQIQYEFDKRRLTDSLANEKEKLQRDLLYKEELQTKRSQRNIFLFAGLAILVLAGGLWSRLRYIRKSAAITLREKERSDELLLNILPFEVAEELKQTGHCKAKTYSLVTVMFTDFKDFTTVGEKISAELMVDELNFCFSSFDAILQKHKVEKIKTIGDAYLCVSGLPVLNHTHAFDLITAALEIRNFMLTRKKEKEAKNEIPFEIRIGIHTGPVVAGIVGIKKFAYDIWGDTVNIAARMESSGEAGKVNISGTTYELVKDKFNCIHRGQIEAKNKGEIDMYFVEVANP
jgi:class 3 adenylate cyclase